MNIDLYKVTWAFLVDRYAYKSGLNGDGPFVIGSSGRCGGSLDGIMEQYIIDLYGKDTLIEVLKEIHEFEYRDDIAFAPDRDSQVEAFREEHVSKLVKKIQNTNGVE